MLAKLHTFALVGIDAVPVVAEVDAASKRNVRLLGPPETVGPMRTQRRAPSPRRRAA